MSRIQPGLPFVRADGGSGGGGGGVGIDLTPILRWLLTPAGLITLAVLLIRRAIRRRLPAGRQLVQRATLDWRAQTLPPGGPHRRLAELQSRLAQERAAG